MLKLAAEIELYKDCLVGDAATCLQCVRARPPFDQIERLQICIPTPAFEITYPQLLRRDDWESLFAKKVPMEKYKWRNVFNLETSLVNVSNAGAQVRRLLQEGTAILSKLKSVTLGGLGELRWNDRDTASYLGICPGSPVERVTAQTFLDLPSIESICQYYLDGPLSLSECIILPHSRLRVFTYHPRPCAPISPMTMPALPPIIIGAVNRYYSGMAREVSSDLPPDREEAIFTGALRPVIMMLGIDRTAVMHTTRHEDRTHWISLEDVNTDRTTVELYDYVRIVDYKDLQSYTCACCPLDGSILKPPLPLDKLQKLLDAHMHPKWKGKVFLKHREDAPPCVSCGLHPQSEHEYETKMERSNGNLAR